eukprot:1608905-Alexandrium_andersonii.AAC.1
MQLNSIKTNPEWAWAKADEVCLQQAFDKMTGTVNSDDKFGLITTSDLAALKKNSNQATFEADLTRYSEALDPLIKEVDCQCVKLAAQMELRAKFASS